MVQPNGAAPADWPIFADRMKSLEIRDGLVHVTFGCGVHAASFVLTRSAATEFTGRLPEAFAEYDRRGDVVKLRTGSG